MTQSDYEKVKDFLSRQEFESRVRAKAQEWAGLLDDRTVALIVLDELGRLEVPFDKIRDLQDAQEVSVRAKVESVGPVRSFTSKAGRQGRVVNIDLSDETGRCRLVLWDDDVRLVEHGLIRAGAMVRALDCYVRRSNFGLEVSRGKFGSVIVEG